MSEEVLAFLSWAEWFLVTEIPPLIVVVIYSWVLARRHWPLRRPFISAVVVTLVGLCSTWLAIATVFRWNVGLSPEWFAAVTAMLIVIQPWAAFLLVAQEAYRDYGGRNAPKRRFTDNQASPGSDPG